MARPRTRDARADRGASAVEYAIILAGVAAGLMLVLLGLQRTVESTYRATAADIAVVSAPQAVATTAPAGPGPGPSSSSPAPSASTSSPAPSASTSSPAPSASTSSPAPGPSRSTATPSPTRPAGSIEVEADHTSDGVAIGWTVSSKSFSATITPSGSGSASIVGGKLVFNPDADTRGAVTVSWKFKNASGGWVTGTTTFWVTS